MAFVECKFYSKSLMKNTSMNVIIPTDNFDDVMLQKETRLLPGVKFKTLYLLHGLSEDYTSWQRNTSIERYAQEKNIAVIMPDGENSLYTDMVHGSRYWTYISEELPYIARSLFPLSELRRDNYVAGASMGGYGAYKLAFLKPNCFSAAASLSGTPDISFMIAMAGKQRGMMKQLLENIFGDLDHVIGSENDLMIRLKHIKEDHIDIPKLYLSCGTEDMSIPMVKNFEKYAHDLGMEITCEYNAGGHNWTYWDESIRRVINWLPGITVGN